LYLSLFEYIDYPEGKSEEGVAPLLDKLVELGVAGGTALENEVNKDLLGFKFASDVNDLLAAEDLAVPLVEVLDQMVSQLAPNGLQCCLLVYLDGRVEGEH